MICITGARVRSSKAVIIPFVLSVAFWVGAIFPDGAAAGEKTLGDMGSFGKWSRVEIVMEGRNAMGRGHVNPFSILVDVVFTGPGGRRHTVPGFYDGDGDGGLDGRVWKVRFAGDEIGQWRFSSKSDDPLLHGYTGSFTITAPPSGARGAYRWGRLESVGSFENRIRYLKFRDGPYWLKAGCDDPENFLGKFKYYDTPAKRRAAVEYLAGKGINAIYIMTHNIGGDGNDVWPWLGSTPEEAKNNGAGEVRFDVAKLDEWRKLFAYMNRLGIVPYLILEDDSAWKGYEHRRYYREMIARFGDLPALIFNIGEEYNENYSLGKALSLAQFLKEIDPYGHPRGIHNVNRPSRRYAGSGQVDFTAIQTKYEDPLRHNALAIDWINLSLRKKKRVLMVGFDEPRPLMDRKGWWSAYMGGGVWEVHVARPYDRPMSAWGNVWKELGGARAFMESFPFWRMHPANGVVVSGTAFCLAIPQECYAVYLPEGGTIRVSLPEQAVYRYGWWDPASGRDGTFSHGGRTQGGLRRFTAPGGGDWALGIFGERFRGTEPQVGSGLVSGSSTVKGG